jgi:hypothetical protein
MGRFRAEKVVSALPTTLAPDTIYCVRVGVGFDLYVSDSTGAVAHKVNAPNNSAGVSDIVKLTQAEHDALPTKSATTLYLITG